MAGTIPLSMTQQFDPLGDPLSGGLLYFLVAGTVSTPQNAFKDLGLTLPHPNPITLDVAGRVPQLFLSDGLIKIRLTDKTGVVQLSADNIQVIGASSGSGGGGAIDATTVAQTGDIKSRYGIGILTGWVRINARTIGSSISGATELADASAQPLYQYLWATDPNLVVVSGRGSTSLADWNANKQLTLPDAKGVVLAGMDDMGGTAAGRLTATYFGANATVLGARGGLESNLLTNAGLPATIGSGITTSISDTRIVPLTNFTLSTKPPDGGNTRIVGVGPGGDTSNGSGANVNLGAPSSGSITATTTLTNTTGGGAHNNTQPTMVVTLYMKL